MSAVANMPLGNFICLCVAVVALAFILIRNIKNFEFGKAKVTVQSDKENRRVLIDSMNFSWNLNQELADGEQFYKRQMRGILKEKTYQYSVMIKGEFRKALAEKYPDDYKLTYATFASTLDGVFYARTIQFFMDCYKNNHVTDLSQEELVKRSRELYDQMSCIFRDVFQGPWLDEMCDYSVLHECCMKMKQDAEQMTFSILCSIQRCLLQLYKLRGAIQNVKDCTARWIVEKGLLPSEAAGLVGTFVETNHGLNVDRVNKYIDLIKLE